MILHYINVALPILTLGIIIGAVFVHEHHARMFDKAVKIGDVTTKDHSDKDQEKENETFTIALTDLELLERVWITFYQKDHNVIKPVYVKGNKYCVDLKKKEEPTK